MLLALVLGMGILGLAVGSFLNVVVYRFPSEESIVFPGSHCPTCGSDLRAWENVPLVSFAILRGHCSHCKGRISPRYPLVEALTGVLFAAISWRFGCVWELPAYLVLAAGLVALGAIDLDNGMLPDKILVPLGIAVAGLLLLASGEYGEWHRALIALVCAAGWFATFFLVNLLAPNWLGFGDVRLAPVLGFALGWLGPAYVLVGFFAGDLVGAIVGITLIAMKRATGNTAVPFGPFLALGCVVAILFGHAILIPLHAG